MLNDTLIRSLKAADKPKKYADGGGLFLYVPLTGSKLWRMTYRFNKKSKLLSFGEYPIVTLKMARDRRDEAKRLLAEGIDPSVHKKEVHAATLADQANLFEAIAHEWHKTQVDKPIAPATMLHALRCMGYRKQEMSVHGFRAMASTLLNELGYNRDWIERQLAHKERDTARDAYNHAQYLPQRRLMMNEWADYLDGLREKARLEVVM